MQLNLVHACGRTFTLILESSYQSLYGECRA
jgi:hypothetical protein